LQVSVPACNLYFLNIAAELLPTHTIPNKPCSESMSKIMKPEILLSRLPELNSGGIKGTGTILGARTIEKKPSPS